MGNGYSKALGNVSKGFNLVIASYYHCVFFFFVFFFLCLFLIAVFVETWILETGEKIKNHCMTANGVALTCSPTTVQK